MDLQQVMIANLMMQLGNHHNAQLDENMLRHMILNAIRGFRQKFPGDHMVIACDSRYSWRKDKFAFYKAGRAKKRAESEIDWHLIFKTFDKMRADLKAFFPYRVIEVEGAEADDIIGVLCDEFGQKGESEFGGLVLGSTPQITILSGDHDFRQLQKYPNVQQYDPVQKKTIKCNTPAQYLKEHIIRGDKGDGVPNFLSADDSIVTNTRQKQIREVKLAQWLKQEPEVICESPEMLRNWKRNEQMVDLSYTPEEIRRQIMDQYHAEAGKDRSKLANYFIANKLKLLHEHLPEF